MGHGDEQYSSQLGKTTILATKLANELVRKWIPGFVCYAHYGQQGLISLCSRHNI